MLKLSIFGKDFHNLIYFYEKIKLLNVSLITFSLKEGRFKSSPKYKVVKLYDEFIRVQVLIFIKECAS